MNAKKLTYILVGIVTVLGLGIFGVGYAANAALSQKTEALKAAKLAGEEAQEQQQMLTQNRSDLKRYAELNAIAKAIVPQDKDQTQTVREIVNIAKESGINKLSSITFPPSTLNNGPTAGVAASNNSTTQLTAVKDIPGVYLLPITVTQLETEAVNYTSVVDFMARLEKNRRTAQVSSLTITPSKTDHTKVGFSIILNEYIQP